MKYWTFFLSFLTLVVLGSAQGDNNDGDGDGDGDKPYPGIPAPPYSPAQFMNIGMLDA
jgi:hypothetical protein